MTTECKGYSVISGYGYGVVIGNGFVVSAELLSTMVFKMDYVLKDKEIYFKNSGSGVDCVGYVASGLELTGNTYINVSLSSNVKSNQAINPDPLGDGSCVSTYPMTSLDELSGNGDLVLGDDININLRDLGVIPKTTITVPTFSTPIKAITMWIQNDSELYSGNGYIFDCRKNGDSEYLYYKSNGYISNSGISTIKNSDGSTFNGIDNLDKYTFIYLELTGTVTDFVLGSYWNGSYNFGGLISQVRFHSRELIDSEIITISQDFDSVTYGKELFVYDYSDNTFHVDTERLYKKIELRTIGHYFKYSDVHNPSDLILLNNTPELLLNKVLGDSDTGLDFDINKIEYMQPDRYSGKTIQCISTDLIPLVGNYNFGTGAHVNQTKIEEGDNWGIVEQTAQGTHYQFPNFQFADSRLENKRIKMKATFDVLEGQYYVGANRGNPGQANSTGLKGIGTYEVEYDLNDNRWYAIDTYERVGIYGDGTNSGETFKVKCTIDAYMLPEYDDIINHRGLASYTNVDQQSKGIPLSKYVQDETGRITGKAETNINEFNGDGRYIGVTWNPRDSFVIEGLIEFTEDRLKNYHGYSSDTHCCFGGYLGGIYAYFSGTAVNKFNLYTNGYHHLAMRYYGPNHPTKPNLLESYTDGILRTHNTVNTPMLTSNALFFIGSRSNGSCAKTNSGIFIFTDGEQADDWDPLEAYDKMVALYPNKLTPRV